MKKLLPFLIVLLFLGGIHASNETDDGNNPVDSCGQIYDFIIEHYNNKLDFTEEDFELLQMRTTMLPDDLKNHISYYNDFCDQELPFLNYNNKWSEGKKDVEVKSQSMKEGFEKFIGTIKEDSIKIIIIISAIILFIWFINKSL